ncbi:glycosyltransferase family 2 protein [Stenotrophomonas sp. S39]|uniref:glycosyltransferase family 2 protein n=1 Tax=Stenotrophomonas sp. S39 TaxID=2767451 RepID=UPI00190BC457|nr:glycosyltransferase family 2 protein [Stenotrophomonas sp. S39]MBK0053473.1 glycosyltransferase family 2 protein [Stenotrophomonas sp. S39]
MEHTESSEFSRPPLVSVVIPVYNRAKSIAATLDSVKDQTERNFECLIVDDGSTDVDDLVSFVARAYDSRFRVLRKENGGASSARNLGIDAARGEYIALLDSDDIWLPEKLSVQLGFASKDPRPNFMCFTQLRVDRGISRTWIKPPRGPRAGERIDEYLMADAGWIQTSTMFLAAPLAKHVRFDENLPSSQDTDFAIRCANAGANITYLEQPLVIMDDRYIPGRVSKQKNYAPLLQWIEKMKSNGEISSRSYYAYRGWQCARVASYTRIPLALQLYGRSLLRRAYGPKIAAVIFLQIILPQSLYQRIATATVKIAGK